MLRVKREIGVDFVGVGLIAGRIPGDAVESTCVGGAIGDVVHRGVMLCAEMV